MSNLPRSKSLRRTLARQRRGGAPQTALHHAGPCTCLLRTGGNSPVFHVKQLIDLRRYDGMIHKKVDCAVVLRQAFASPRKG